MKAIILVLVFCITNHLYAQQETNWKLGIEISQDFLTGENYLITSAYTDGYLIDYTELNYSIGISSGFKVNERLTINSGLLFSNKNVSGAYNCATCDFTGDVISSLVKQYYLSVPVSISYRILKSKLSADLKLGFMNNINTVNELGISNNYFIEGFAGFLLSYKLSKKLDGQIGYNYRSALTDIYKQNSIASNNYDNLKTNSLTIGMNYILK